MPGIVGQVPWCGVCKRQPTLMFLSLSFSLPFSLPSPLSENKIFFLKRYHLSQKELKASKRLHVANFHNIPIKNYYLAFISHLPKCFTIIFISSHASQPLTELNWSCYAHLTAEKTDVSIIRPRSSRSAFPNQTLDS